MTARFAVDLLHPGRVARTWREWFVGTQGRRRLILSAVGCVAVLLLGAVVQIPIYLRLSTAQGDIPKLRRDLTNREGDLRVLRADLQALALEAKRQIRWGEVLKVFSQQVPPTLKLTKVEALRAAPAPAPSPGQPAPAAQPVPGEGELKIEAVTPLKPGSPNMVEIAQFMAGLVKDPGVNKRFELKSWEIKPVTAASVGAAATGEAAREQFLQIIITLAERGR